MSKLLFPLVLFGAIICSGCCNALICVATTPDPIDKAEEINEHYRKAFCSAVSVYTTEGPMGSGNIIEVNGEYYVMTAYHVLDDRNKKAKHLIRPACYSDEYKVTYGTPVFLDARRDVALILVDDQNWYGNKFAVKVAKKSPKVGDTIYIIGSPSDFQGDMHHHSFIKGVISNKELINGRIVYRTTAPFIQGYSGSAAFNEKGEIVGMCQFLYMLGGFSYVPGSFYLLSHEELASSLRSL